MANPSRMLGIHGETLAAAHLQAAGMRLVARNWRCVRGEIDLVMVDNAQDFSRGLAVAEWLVFVEVRTRRGTRFGTARESVAHRKQAKLRELAEMYIQLHQWSGPWRIDVVAVQMQANHPPHIEHIRHAVDAGV